MRYVYNNNIIISIVNSMVYKMVTDSSLLKKAIPFEKVENVKNNCSVNDTKIGMHLNGFIVIFFPIKY